jgi:DNA-directed RNA polymerase specialized sigma24 family protein
VTPTTTFLGDTTQIRVAIARFVLENEARIRALIRRKIGPATRGVFDSEDVVASVLRRMDQLASRGRLRLDSERELWGLVITIAHNSAVSKTRLIERWRSFSVDEAPEVLPHINACAGDDDALVLIYKMAMALEESGDRQLFFLRLRGASHAAAAQLTGVTEENARKRWERVCKRLRERFGERT